MTDDLSRIVGKLEAGFESVKDMLKEQNDQHVRDKEDAIRERDRRHEENKTEMRNLRAAIDSTALITQRNDKWITEIGAPMHKAWSASQEAKKAAKNRRLGAAAVWGSLAAGVGALGTVIGFIGLDGIAHLLARLAERLGAH